MIRHAIRSSSRYRQLIQIQTHNNNTRSIVVRSISASPSSNHIQDQLAQLASQWKNQFQPQLDHDHHHHQQQQQILSCSMMDTKISIHDERIITRVIHKIIKHAKNLWDVLMVLLRTSEIGLRLSPLIILTPAAILASKSSAMYIDSSGDKQEHNKSILSNIAWRYTLYTIQKLGPAFIKISQWAATRRDIFPSNVCDRLSDLHDATFVHSWSHTHKILTEALGDDYTDRLEIHKDDIIGSGSVAQVYSGLLQEDDVNIGTNTNNDTNNYTDTNEITDGKGKRKVAVKVLHPNIQYHIDRDLLLMERAANIIDSIPSTTIKMLSLPRACSNFKDIMQLQIDLRNESHNLDKFRVNFKCKANNNNNQSKVSFPEPIISEFDCLVEDYMGGEDSKPISDYLFDDSNHGRVVRRKLAGPLLRAFLKMVFMDNFIHCDLHPGNIMVKKIQVVHNDDNTNDNTTWWNRIVKTDDGDTPVAEDKYVIVFLDAGIVTALNDNDQKNLKDLFKAVILNNGEEAGRLMIERARYERCTHTEGGLEQFSNGIGQIVSEFHDRRKHGLTLGVVRIGSLLARVLDLCRIHQVEIDPAMANVVMSTLVLEGLGRALEPNLNLFDIALPFVLGRGQV